MSIQSGLKNNILIEKKSVIVYVDHFLLGLVPQVPLCRKVRRSMGKKVGKQLKVEHLTGILNA